LSTSPPKQSDFEKRIVGILPPSFPIVVPFKYFPGGDVEISVSSKTFVLNNTVLDSLLYLEQEVKLNLNTPEFSQFEMTSVDLVPFGAAGQLDSGASSSTGKGGMIGGVIAAVCVVMVGALLLAYRYKRSKPGEENARDDLEMNMQEELSDSPSSEQFKGGKKGKGQILPDLGAHRESILMEANRREVNVNPESANQVWGAVKGDYSREVWNDFVNRSAETPTNRGGWEEDI